MYMKIHWCTASRCGFETRGCHRHS